MKVLWFLFLFIPFNVISQSHLSTKEEFKNFLYRFKTDKAFQRKHTFGNLEYFNGVFPYVMSQKERKVFLNFEREFASNAPFISEITEDEENFYYERTDTLERTQTLYIFKKTGKALSFGAYTLSRIRKDSY